MNTHLPEVRLRRGRALLVCLFALLGWSRVARSQVALRAERPLVRPDAALPLEPIAASAFRQDSAISYRRANLIGATSGVVLGGLGAAGYILNALAPDCLTAVAAVGSGPTARSSHCTNRSGIVVLETVTIAAGATAGGFAGAWLARRIVDWRHRHRRE